MKAISTRVVALLLIVAMFASCAMDGKTPEYRAVNSYAARVIREKADSVSKTLLEENAITDDEYRLVTSLSGEEIVRRVRTIEGGDDILDYFAYTTDEESYGFIETDEVLKKAEKIIGSGEEMDELRRKVEENKESIVRSMLSETNYRALNAKQKAEFDKEVTAAVVTALVLTVSAVVYACIPTTILWGKIIAAVAIAVTAGVLAHSASIIFRYYKGDIDSKDKAFKEWVEGLEDPVKTAAIATTIYNTAFAITKTPVAAALVLGMFAIWQVKDDFQEIFKEYNLKA